MCWGGGMAHIVSATGVVPRPLFPLGGPPFGQQKWRGGVGVGAAV